MTLPKNSLNNRLVFVKRFGETRTSLPLSYDGG